MALNIAFMNRLATGGKKNRGVSLTFFEQIQTEKHGFDLFGIRRASHEQLLLRPVQMLKCQSARTRAHSP
jgi:hypothetical protein